LNSGVFCRFKFSIMKILVIEDETALQHSIQKYLEHQGYVVETVGTSEKEPKKLNYLIMTVS
jgi:DNA-binding response OmpR family regulator